MNLDSELNIKKLINSKNIAEELSKKDIDAITQQVLHDYQLDRESRAEWEAKNAESLKLALQVVEEKTTPWPGAANVKFPLVSVAALQSHAREYPALLSGTELVKCRVIGDDPTGEKTERAKRVAAHMSYQILEEDPDWENQMDKVMITKPIIGTAFKKIYFDPIRGHNVSESILAQDLVIPYKAKSLEKASRITQVIELSRNDIYERVVRGVYLDVVQKNVNAETTEQGQLDQVSDEVQGRHNVMGDDNAPITILEQHRYLDLDGDGYAEPYIVTVTEQTQQLLRIVARYFDDDITYKDKTSVILNIRPQQFFVKYGMIPSPDGGIYDLGFGLLLGPLNRTVNTIINQLLDAGTLSTLGGGFLGRGAKLRRGQNQFVPGEWKQVDGSGNDLKASIVPLPIREPSNVLFTLLSLLISYGERISGATDIMSGQNVGQNTPASTAQELVKQGSVIFNSIFKRTYRSLKEEFRLLYRLNQVYLQNSATYENMSTGATAKILIEDYRGNETDIRPASDPNVASVERRMQQAIFLKQASMQGPGYNPLAVEKRLLQAANIPYIDEVWNEQTPPTPDKKFELEMQKLKLEQMKIQGTLQMKAVELTQEAMLIEAEVQELRAKAIKALAEAKGVDADNAVNLINAQLQAKKLKQDGIMESLKLYKEMMQLQQQGGTNAGIQNTSNAGGSKAMAVSSRDQGGQEIPPLSNGGLEGQMG